MENKKISEMTAATTIAGTELISIVQGGVNKTVTPDLLHTSQLNNTDVAIIQLMGSTIKAVPIGLPLGVIGLQGIGMTSNRAYYVAFYLTTPQTLTGVNMVMNTTGDYTANNFNGVALYSVSGGTLTQRAVSTDDGNIWKATANTLITKAFAATYAAPAGLYYVAYVYNSSAQTTQPKVIAGPGAVSGIGLLATTFSNSLFLSASITPSNTLPTPTIEANTISTALTQIPFVALY